MDGAVVDEKEVIDTFLNSIPEEIWIELITTQRRELHKICVALTLDLYFIENESISNR